MGSSKRSFVDARAVLNVISFLVFVAFLILSFFFVFGLLKTINFSYNVSFPIYEAPNLPTLSQRDTVLALRDQRINGNTEKWTRYKNTRKKKGESFSVDVSGAKLAGRGPTPLKPFIGTPSQAQPSPRGLTNRLQASRQKRKSRQIARVSRPSPLHQVSQVLTFCYGLLRSFIETELYGELLERYGRSIATVWTRRYVRKDQCCSDGSYASLSVMCDLDREGRRSVAMGGAKFDAQTFDFRTE